MSDPRTRAIALARQVLRSNNLGIALVPSESTLLATEFLRALGMLPVSRVEILPVEIIPDRASRQ